MDLYFQLKHIYNRLDSLDRLASEGKPIDHDELKSIAAGIRADVDSIAEQVDYETDDEEDEETDDEDGLDMLMGSRPDDEE